MPRHPFGVYLPRSFAEYPAGSAGFRSNAEKPDMPGIENVTNTLLQIVTIGIGSPLGKEGAHGSIGILLAILLGIAGKMPVTTIVLLPEMSQASLKPVAPMAVCMASALLAQNFWRRHQLRK